MERLGKTDKAVIRAFTERRALDGHKLTTDGTLLDGNWMGGNGLAVWKDGKIHFSDSGSRSGQLVQRAVAREAPKNDLYNGRGYNPAKNPRRRHRRARRRNPRLDGAAALGLGVVGAGIGIVASLLAQTVSSTWKRTAIAALAGGTTGAVLGAVLPKGRAANSSNNPLENPIGLATAVGAGIVLALVPVAAVAEYKVSHRAMGRSAAPTVRAKMGGHDVDVYRNGPTWAWRAPGLDMAGAGDSRRDAIVNAYSEIVVADLQPTDRLTLDFYPEQFQLQIDTVGGDVLAWRWNTLPSGEGNDGTTRGDALLQALDWVDAHSELS